MAWVRQWLRDPVTPPELLPSEAADPLRVLQFHGTPKSHEEHKLCVSGAIVHRVREEVALLLQESDVNQCVFKLYDGPEDGHGRFSDHTLWYSLRKGESFGVLMGYNRHTGDFTSADIHKYTAAQEPQLEAIEIYTTKDEDTNKNTCSSSCSSAVAACSESGGTPIVVEVFYDDEVTPTRASIRKKYREPELTAAEAAVEPRSRRTPKKAKFFDEK